MFSNLATKVALKKVGLPSDTFDFSSWKTGGETKPAKKITKSQKQQQPTGNTNNTNSNNNAVSNTTTNNKSWPEWMSVKSLPLTVQPWLTPRPPPIPVADPPRVGDLAPLDPDRKLVFGGGRKVVVVFLRCVGCAFAQKSYLALHALAAKHPPSTLTCIAVSHSSQAATRRWLDLILPRSVPNNVTLLIDESRALYAAWGLGLASAWYMLNPASQVAGFREKGWLGERVAGSLPGRGVLNKGGVGDVDRMVGEGEANGPVTTMGSKWQIGGAWAVDERGTVVWGGLAGRVEEVVDLEGAVRALGVEERGGWGGL